MVRNIYGYISNFLHVFSNNIRYFKWIHIKGLILDFIDVIRIRSSGINPIIFSSFIVAFTLSSLIYIHSINFHSLIWNIEALIIIFGVVKPFLEIFTFKLAFLIMNSNKQYNIFNILLKIILVKNFLNSIQYIPLQFDYQNIN